jgi:hypothetical protein
MLEAEADYVRDLATRWQSYSYVSAGAGLVLAIIAASMRGYTIHGESIVSPGTAYGIAMAIFGAGCAGCAVFQFVGRRLRRDLEQARVESVASSGRADPAEKYVRVAAGGAWFLVRRADWERLALPAGDLDRIALEYAPASRVVLTVNGAPVYAG